MAEAYNNQLPTLQEEGMLMNYKCIFCKNFVSAPVKQLACGHRACGKCVVETSLNKGLNFCPGNFKQCKSVDINISEHVSTDFCAERELQSVRVRCKNPGCEKIVFWSQMQEHSKSCKDEASHQKEFITTQSKQRMPASKGGYDVDHRQCHEKIEQLQNQVDDLKNRSHVMECKMRSLSNLVTASQGEYEWEIMNVLEKLHPKFQRRSALSPKFTLPKPLNYELCLKSVFHTCKNNTIDLYIHLVIIKADHNDLLPWPFKQNFVIVLTNTKNGQDMYQAKVTPDVNWACVKKPELQTQPIQEPNSYLYLENFELKYSRFLTDNNSLIVKVTVDTECHYPVQNSVETCLNCNSVESKSSPRSPVNLLSNPFESIGLNDN